MKLIIDGNNLAIRSFFKMPELTNARGVPTGAAHGFFQSLFVLIREHNPDDILIAWDEGRADWREHLYPDYKGNRKSNPEFYEQITLIQKILDHSRFHSIHIPGVEADDIIGALAQKFHAEMITIFSGDTDFLQMIKPGVSILTPKGEHITYESKNVFFGEQYLFAKCFVGDSSDNIKGVDGVGEKTAAEIIERVKAKVIQDFSRPAAMAVYASMKKCVKAIDQKIYLNVIFRNWQLMSLEHGAGILGEIELKKPLPNPDKMLELMHKLELKKAAENIGLLV